MKISSVAPNLTHIMCAITIPIHRLTPNQLIPTLNAQKNPHYLQNKEERHLIPTENGFFYSLYHSFILLVVVTILSPTSCRSSTIYMCLQTAFLSTMWSIRSRLCPASGSALL